jgi:hypothetical protein
MTNQKVARTISSFTTPTGEDLASFESLLPVEQRTLLRTEIDKGTASGLSDRSFDEIVAKLRS